MENIENKLLKKITSKYSIKKGAYSIRRNGKTIEKNVNDNVNIVNKKDKQGIDIYVKENTKNETIHIPVIITESGINDIVYNDFYIGKNSSVDIISGCGIHNNGDSLSKHNGVHRFFLEEGAKVKYVEKHIGEGNGSGEKILNPQTEINLKEGSALEMNTTQIKGVDSTIRETKGILEDDTNLIITEKIMTHGNQFAKTIFDVKLNGKNSSTKVVSRSIAKDNSKQEFLSKVEGNNNCFGHVECDAIIMDEASVQAIPEITANDVNAKLVHEASIGKIAGEQVIKLMSLGLTEKQAKKEIINGFLK